MDDPAPKVTTRALLVHLVGQLDGMHVRMEAIEIEQRLQRQAFEEHQRAVKRHRYLNLAAHVLEWRATLLTLGAASVAWVKWPAPHWPDWLQLPWRK